MDNLYTIGETAKIMGISVQSLRKYSNMGLISPEYIDPQTGYRYFSFYQFHYIDKIKYFRELGVPLLEIKEAISINNNDKLVQILKKQKAKLETHIKETQSSIENINWYINYFEYLKKYKNISIPYILYVPKRYALGVSSQGKTTPQTETQLAKLRHSKEGAHLKYLRQYGYTIDFNSLTEQKFTSLSQFMFLQEVPPDISNTLKDAVLEFPAGEYLCFINKKSLKNNDYLVFNRLKELKSTLVIASEFENNLMDYGGDLQYKFEILLTEDKT